MTRREILLKAIEVIEERGWSQGARDKETGPVCIQHAVCVAGDYPFMNKDGALTGVYCDAAELLGSRESWAWQWNDITRRTKEEVIAALRFLADTDMSWDDAMDLWRANENLSPLYDTPVEEPALVAV